MRPPVTSERQAQADLAARCAEKWFEGHRQADREEASASRAAGRRSLPSGQPVSWTGAALSLALLIPVAVVLFGAVVIYGVTRIGRGRH